jgi:hypothetical protein
VTRQDGVQAGGGGVVGVGETHERGEERGHQVPVTGQATLRAVVDAVGEGLADLFAAQARLRQL